MGRLFAYARVSTTDQHPENQRLSLAASGYNPEPHRYFEESISGRVPANSRPVFSQLLQKLEAGDTLVVLKLDRLGRDAQDILATVKSLQAIGVRVMLLDAGAGDLGTATGQLWLTLLAAFAQFESDRLSERTKEGMARSSKKPGRRPAIKTTDKIQNCRHRGFTQQETATATGLSLSTVKRHWKLAVPDHIQE